MISVRMGEMVVQAEVSAETIRHQARQRRSGANPDPVH
jgi:hypothetical protein